MKTNDSHAGFGSGRRAIPSFKPKERPILFSDPMVEAILAGTKTQTRRLVKGELLGIDPATNEPFAVRSTSWCPYGAAGDELWVREAWAPVSHAYSKKTLKDAGVIYRAGRVHHTGAYPIRWKPSIHMFRKASRIQLMVTEVRVQRLQDISEEDAEAEGVRPDPEVLDRVPYPSHPFKDAYAKLWDQINGKTPGSSWAANPWVWVVSFKRLNP